MVCRNLCLLCAITVGTTAWAQQKTDLGPDFTKAAIRALVAVKNQTLDGSDQPVKAAINDAEVEASSKAELVALDRIKGVSALRRIWMELNSRAIALSAHDLIASTQARFDEQGACIDALRLAMKSRDGDLPKECGAIFKK